MNVIVAIGNWEDPGKALDTDAPGCGRIVRGRVMIGWSKSLDPQVFFNLTLSLLLGGGLKLDQSMTIRRAE